MTVKELSRLFWLKKQIAEIIFKVDKRGRLSITHKVGD